MWVERGHTVRKVVLLHEVMHHLAPDREQASQGAEFDDRYTRLVTEIVGPAAGLLLPTMNENGRT